MAKTNIKLYNGTLSDANVTLYTVPAGKQTIVKSLSLCNKTSSAATVILKLDGIHLLYELSIEANATYIMSAVDQILDTSDLIEGNASVGAAIDCIISGFEIDL